MPRFFAFVFLAFLSLPGSAQRHTISGRVLDAETGLPVKFAHVAFAGTFCGTATNRNGEFSINLNTCNGDDIVVSSAPYRQKVLSLDPARQYIEILLERRKLERTFRREQTQICAIVDSALSKIDDNYHDEDLAFTSFHRERVNYFHNIVQLFEAVIETSRGTQGNTSRVEDALYAEEKHQREIFWEPSKGGFYTFGWNPIPGELKPSGKYFLGVHLRKKGDIGKYYNFTHPGVLKDSSGTTYVFDFDQKDHIKGALLKGRMYIDSLTSAISRIEYSISPKGQPYVLPNRTIGGVLICKLPMRLNIVNETSVINYKKHGSRWALSSEFSEVQFNATVDSTQKQKWNTPEHYLKLHSERVVTKIDTTVENISKESTRGAVINHDYIKSHFENYNPLRSRWEADMIVKADTSVVDVIRTLRMNNQLWERKEGWQAKNVLTGKTTFSALQLQQDLQYLKKMFLALHPVLEDPAKRSHFTRMVGNASRHIQRTLAEREFHRYLTPVIESLHCGHSQVFASPLSAEYNRKFGKYFPFGVTVIGRRAFLTGDVADSARGAEVVGVNDVPVSSVLQNIRYRISSEGTSPAMKDHEISHNFATLYAGNYPEPDSFRIQLRLPGKEKPLMVVAAPVGHRKKDIADVTPTRQIDSLETVIFSPPLLQEEQMRPYLDKIFKLIGEQHAVTNLVIDLRDNQSLREGDAALLYGHLTGAPYLYYQHIRLFARDTTLLKKVFTGDEQSIQSVRSFRTGIAINDSSVQFVTHSTTADQFQNASPFNGNVYIFVNGGSNAPSAHLASMLQNKGRATVIGQAIVAPFHGSLDLGQTYIILPHSKIRISLPLAEYHPAQVETLSRNVQPDHVVQYSVSDLIEKRDKEMETFREIVVKNCCTAKSN